MIQSERPFWVIDLCTRNRTCLESRNADDTCLINALLHDWSDSRKFTNMPSAIHHSSLNGVINLFTTRQYSLCRIYLYFRVIWYRGKWGADRRLIYEICALIHDTKWKMDGDKPVALAAILEVWFPLFSTLSHQLSHHAITRDIKLSIPDHVIVTQIYTCTQYSLYVIKPTRNKHI